MMRINQDGRDLEILFEDAPITRSVPAMLSVVDLDRDRDIICGVEVLFSRLSGDEIAIPESLPAGVTYDAMSNAMYVRVNRDLDIRFPTRCLNQPHITTHLLLSSAGILIGLEIELPPLDRAWPADTLNR